MAIAGQAPHDPEKEDVLARAAQPLAA